MKIVSIFERSKDCLYAVMYDDSKQDALEILQEKWTDPEELRKFFIQYKKDYEAYYGKAIKLTEQMKNRPHTKFELHKLNLVKEYLKQKGEDAEFVYLDI